MKTDDCAVGASWSAPVGLISEVLTFSVVSMGSGRGRSSVGIGSSVVAEGDSDEEGVEAGFSMNRKLVLELVLNEVASTCVGCAGGGDDIGAAGGFSVDA